MTCDAFQLTYSISMNLGFLIGKISIILLMLVLQRGIMRTKGIMREADLFIFNNNL